jgi:hypothetical protein
MGFYVLVQPDEQSSVFFTEHSVGHPSLMVENSGSTITFQIAAQPEGPVLAAKFARMMGISAARFASRCDELSHSDSTTHFDK